MDQEDPEIARAVALGRRNAEVIELFERFCRNVRVELTGGTGTVELDTGLPIGQRSFRCKYASGTMSAGSNLEYLAVEFYEEHCRECADRVRPGLLGRDISAVADEWRAADRARADQAAAEAEARLNRRDQRAARRTRRSAGQPYLSVQQLERVGRLDPPDGSPASSDIEWLVRTASLGPELVSEITVDELVELAGDPEAPRAVREAAQAVLVPVAGAGRVPEETAARIALASLAEGAGMEAGKLLVNAANAVQAGSVTPKVARSAVELAGRSGDPWARNMSRFTRKPVVSDPAPLLLCAARNLETVLQVVKQMLAAAGRQPPVVLVGPDGQPFGAPRSLPGDPGPQSADRPRGMAAAACLPLIQAVPGAAPGLVTALALSLEIPDQDRYDAPPSTTIGRTLGLALLRDYDAVAPSFEESARRVSEEARVSLFEAISFALNDDSAAVTPADVPRVVQLAVDRLQGDWGERVSLECALMLRDLARFTPERLEGRAGGLVGALAVEISRPADPAPGLLAPPDPLSGVMAAARRQYRQTRIKCLTGAVGFLLEAGADDAAQALFSLLDAEDDGGAEAIAVRAAATSLLGKIGSRPVHLPAVVPRLYTGLLHADPSVRRAAVRSWADLAGQPQPLPSTLLDVLPALLTDNFVAASAMRLVTKLDIPPEQRDELLNLVSAIAVVTHRAAFDGDEAFTDTCIRAIRSLVRDLPDQEAEPSAARALALSDRVSAHDLRSLLLSWWPPRLANSGLFAERALSVLACPEFADHFNSATTACRPSCSTAPTGPGSSRSPASAAVADLHLPDRPWPALEMIEVLQRAGRWDDAEETARHIAASIPGDREHEARARPGRDHRGTRRRGGRPRDGHRPGCPATPAQSGRRRSARRHPLAVPSRRSGPARPAPGQRRPAAAATWPTSRPGWSRQPRHPPGQSPAARPCRQNPPGRHGQAPCAAGPISCAGTPRPGRRRERRPSPASRAPTRRSRAGERASGRGQRSSPAAPGRTERPDRGGPAARRHRRGRQPAGSVPLPVRIIEVRDRRYLPPAAGGQDEQAGASGRGLPARRGACHQRTRPAP